MKYLVLTLLSLPLFSCNSNKPVLLYYCNTPLGGISGPSNDPHISIKYSSVILHTDDNKLVTIDKSQCITVQDLDAL